MVSLGRNTRHSLHFSSILALGMPAEPLLQKDFSNPLFLGLVCEALQASGKQAIPAGREGIRSMSLIFSCPLRIRRQRMSVIMTTEKIASARL